MTENSRLIRRTHAARSSLSSARPGASDPQRPQQQHPPVAVLRSRRSGDRNWGYKLRFGLFVNV